MPAVKQISLDELKGALGEYRDEAFEDLRQATIEGCLKSLPTLVRASPVDTGQYANSWDVVFDRSSVLIGNFAPHAAIIEFGTRPFTPPLAPLLAWAKRVLGDPSQPPGYSPEVWKLAKGVQAKIAKEGIRPRHILSNNQDMILQNIREELQARG